MTFKAPSNPNRSVILWFHDSCLSAFSKDLFQPNTERFFGWKANQDRHGLQQPKRRSLHHSPMLLQRTRAGCSLILKSWWNKWFKTQEQEKLSPPSFSLLFECIKIAIRANMAKLHIQLLLFFTLQALRSQLCLCREPPACCQTANHCSNDCKAAVAKLFVRAAQASPTIVANRRRRALHFHLLCILQGIICCCDLRIRSSGWKSEPTKLLLRSVGERALGQRRRSPKSSIQRTRPGSGLCAQKKGVWVNGRHTRRHK